MRLRGLRELANGDPSQGLDLIFRAFGDSSWRVRKEAIDLFLGMPVSHELIGEIIELLHAEENAGLRNAAVEILGRIGRDAVPMLLDQAGCADHDVRKFIVDILGHIRAPEAIPTLIGALEDEDSNVRAAAAENLGELQSRAAVPALLKAMRHPDLLLQFTILEALGRIGAPLPIVELLPYKDEKLLRKALIDCLGKTGDASAVTELVRGLTDSMRNVREAAIMATVEIAGRHSRHVLRELAACEKGPAAAAVSAFLDKGINTPLRKAAIRVLGWLGDGRSVAPLLNLLAEEALQTDASAALVEIGRVAPQALLAAWPETAGERRACLAYALGEAGCTEAMPLLLQGLHDSDSQVVRMVAHALGCIGNAGVLSDLVTCLQGGDPEVSETAVQSLINLGQRSPAKTFAAIKPLLANSDAKQRMLGVKVLRELDDPEVFSTLGMAVKDPSAEVRRAAVKVFARGDAGQHLGPLLLALTDEDTEVRRIVVDILAGCPDEDALEGLKLALQDDDIWVRCAAVRGLGRQGGGHVRPLLVKALADPIGLVTIAALETLVELPDSDAVPQLIAALDHRDEEVVTAAMNLLAESGSTEWVAKHAVRLLDHPVWMVRAQTARSTVAGLGAAAGPLLSRRLAVETEPLVRQLLTDLLDQLK